jgi:transposase
MRPGAVMNFGSGTVAFGHGYSKSVSERCVRRRMGVRGSLLRARPRGRPTTRVRPARGPQRTEVGDSTGSPWRYMPHDLPPWEAVYQQTQRWIRAGVFEKMVHGLRVLLRLSKGRASEPSVACERLTGPRCLCYSR